MKLKKIKYKYKLIDENFELEIFEDVIIKLNLLYKKEIDEELYQKILEENNYYEKYHATLKFIKKRIRSKKEIIDFLEKNGLSQEMQESIVLKLEELNLISDEIFCNAFVNDKIKLTNDGPKKIYKELLEHNIEVEIIKKYILDLFTEDIIEQKVEKIAQKKFHNDKYSNYATKKRIIEHLQMLGYEREDLVDCLAKLNKSDDELLKKEYEKAYKKYSTLLEGVELKKKILYKLVSKGFKFEEIREQEKNY